MIFKKNNPGCPCCECPCYKFNDNAEDSTGNKHLTATSEAYADGILGRAGSFTGSSHYTHAHDDCFSPAASDDVWRMWFWFKAVADPSAPSGGFDYHGVITKGEFNHTYPGLSILWELDGEWAVVWKTDFSSGADLLFLYKSSSVATGIFGGTGIIVGDQYFFHWQINNTTKAAALTGWNATTGASLTIPSSVFGGSGGGVLTEITGTMSVDESHPLRIGNNTGGNGLILGAESGSFLIDNVGFSNKPGTAVNLYNSGVGKACPNQGK